MNREFQITPTKTYASLENARKAVAKSSDDASIRHFYMTTPEGRWFPVFQPTSEEVANTGVHFRWNCI